MLEAPGRRDENRTILRNSARMLSCLSNVMVLVLTLFGVSSCSTSYSSASVDRLKQKIVDLDQKRLVIMFKALADVQDVVGYGKDKEPIYKHFYDYEHLHNEKQSNND